MARVPALKSNRRYLSAIFAVLLLGVGCDGGNDSPPSDDTPPPPGPSGAIQVRGNERIAWLQQTESGNVNGYQFSALVDDVAVSLSGVQCPGSGATVDCSAPLPRMSPGLHKFQLLATNAQGVQSPPSDALRLNVVAGQSAPADESTSTLCGTCASVETLAGGLGRVHRLIALPNGDLLVLHDGQNVLRMHESVVAEAARVDSARDPLTRWVDLDVHPGFPDTPFVFALAVDERADGSRTTSVVRLRAAGDVLGEQVTVVPAIPVNSSAQPEFAVGVDGMLYLAIPQAEEGRRAAAYDGMLLRFTADGSAAGNDAGTSPVFSYGVARPAAMSWDVRQRLWLLESDEDVNRASALLPVSAPAGDAWPRRLNQLVWSTSLRPTQVSGLMFVNDGAGARAFLTAGAPGALLEATPSLDAATLAHPRAVLGGTDAFNVTAAAAGANGQLFVAGTARDGKGSSVLRVTVARQP
jgi:hypothetical protein